MKNKQNKKSMHNRCLSNAIASFIIVAIFSGNTAFGSSSSSSSSGAPQLNTWYALLNKSGTRYLDTDADGKVDWNSSKSGNDKQWRMKNKGSDGYFNLENRATNRGLLDADAGGGIDYVTSGASSGDSDKKWRLIDKGSNYYNLDCKQSGRGVLDANNDGSVRWVSSNSSNDNDKLWKFVNP